MQDSMTVSAEAFESADLPSGNPFGGIAQIFTCDYNDDITMDILNADELILSITIKGGSNGGSAVPSLRIVNHYQRTAHIERD